MKPSNTTMTKLQANRRNAKNVDQKNSKKPTLKSHMCVHITEHRFYTKHSTEQF